MKTKELIQFLKSFLEGSDDPEVRISLIKDRSEYVIPAVGFVERPKPGVITIYAGNEIYYAINFDTEGNNDE